MNEKQLLALAAIGAAVWYFMKKGGPSVTAATKPAIAPAAGSGGIWDGFGVGGAGLGAAMGQAAATTQPLTTPAAIYDNKPLNIGPAPAPATIHDNKPLNIGPAPAPAPSRAVFGGHSSSGGSQLGGYLDSDGVWHYPDGTTYKGRGTMTGQQVGSILGNG